MGLFFTLLYIFTAVLAPETVFGNLAQYHIEIVIALLALLFSLPSIGESDLVRIPQTYGLLGLFIVVPVSIAFSGWVGGAPAALLNFIPNAMAFFFILLNFRKKFHFQLLVAVLLFCTFFDLAQGIIALRANNATSPYVLSMANDAGEYFFRIRGVSFLNDPNDFSQFMVGLIPCVFIFWSKGKAFRNFFLVILPVVGMLVGMFFTHSRGAMVALMAAGMVAGRRKIGLLPAVALGAVLFLGLSAAGWAGGRSVSAESGEDRMDAWSEGLILIRTHPIFGVGFQRFTEYHEVTAHNTVVVCAAELGSVGLLSLMLLIIPTIRDAIVGSKDPAGDKGKKRKQEKGYPLAREPMVVSSADASVSAMALSPTALWLPKREPRDAAAKKYQPRHGTDPAPAVPEPSAATRPGNLYGSRETNEDPVTNDEIRRLCRLMVIALAGFLTAGWFLSRAYSMPIFLFSGMTVALYGTARKRGIAPPPLPLGSAVKRLPRLPPLCF